VTKTQPGQLFRHRTSKNSYAPNDEVKRFYDPRFKAMSVMVLPGRHYVTSAADEMIVTLLGSCVAACIRDPIAAVGGLNHFLLPESDTGQWGQANAAMRYGNHAMETLINDIIKRGGERSRLEIKVFGGARVIDSKSASSVGEQNAEFVESYLQNEGFTIVAKHLGGPLPRRIHYFPVSGKVNMLLLRRGPDNELFKKEKDYQQTIKAQDDSGDIELFE
jgi:chemotaxis protein CheD